MKTALYELTLCRLRALRREPSALFFVFLFPVLILIGAYFVTGQHSHNNTPLDHIIFATTTEDLEELKHAIESSHPSQNNFLFEFPYPIELTVTDDKEHIQSQLELNQIHGAFTVDVTPPPNHQVLITYKLASIDPEPMMIFHNTLTEQIREFDTPQRAPLITTISKKEPPIGSFIPGFFALTIMANTIFGMGMTLVTSRREGILKRFLTTPMSSVDYVASHLISRQILLLIEFGIIVGLGMILFNFDIKGSVLLFIIMSMWGTLMLSFMCFTLASRTSNTSTYSSMANICLLICTLSGGGFFSLSAFPEWVQTFATLTPLNPVVESLRGITHQGWVIADLGNQFMLITLYTVIFAALSHYLFIWYDS